jgi:hypothetical protein
MEKRSRRRIRDLVAQPASLGLSENEIGCARISMMARNTNVPFKGRIQKRKTYHLQIITFCLQRAAGPYRSATSGCKQPQQKKSRYSIASSARPNSVIGKVRPSDFAVLRLMTNSVFVDCWTGRSAGFSPLRRRPI